MDKTGGMRFALRLRSGHAFPPPDRMRGGLYAGCPNIRSFSKEATSVARMEHRVIRVTHPFRRNKLSPDVDRFGGSSRIPFHSIRATLAVAALIKAPDPVGWVSGFIA